MKIKKQTFALAFCFFALVACKNDTVKKDNGLQEVRLDEKTSNADIIRLPISADNKNADDMAKITFAETSHDFGTVKEGTIVKYSFGFKNTGIKPLLITDVQTTCGCTVPSYDKTPIAPNAEGKIEVAFDSNGRAADVVEKKITVLANTLPAETVLVLRGGVKK